MAENKAGTREKIKTVLQKIAFFFLHNWPWKLLSLFLAVCLWSALITSDDTLTREKVFNDVSINVLNGDTLRRNGLIIVSGLENLPTVRLQVNVPQRAYAGVTAANYNVRVDLSKVTGTGIQKLPIIASSTSAYGSVAEISMDSITVEVEEYSTRSRIPVRLNVSGSAPEGFYAGDARVDPSYVSISGPTSLINTVVRCVADYSMSMITPRYGLERTAVPFRLINAVGEEIDQTLITVTSESVNLDSMTVEQMLYTAKELVINTTDLLTGSPAAGYVVKRISAEPSVLTAAGTEHLISQLNELHLIEYIDQAIDISGSTATLHRSIRLSRSTDIAHLSSDTILLTVEIVKE